MRRIATLLSCMIAVSLFSWYVWNTRKLAMEGESRKSISQTRTILLTLAYAYDEHLRAGDERLGDGSNIGILSAIAKGFSPEANPSISEEWFCCARRKGIDGKDGWGRTIDLIEVENLLYLRSAGPDLKRNTPDDILEFLGSSQKKSE